jgi:carbonic anhydrase/acetyltransferase-like protein (isoleucine patch superfamily)
MPARLEAFGPHSPRLDPLAWAHDSAVLIGDVEVAARCTLWPTTVLRGDQGAIRVGRETSLQDGTIVHATLGLSTTSVGARVTVGHRVILHGCTVGDDCLIGMGSIVLDNAVVEPFSIIGAGAVVPPGMRVPRGSLVMGVPGRVVRAVRDAEVEGLIRHGHAEYQRLWARYTGADAG